MLWPLRWCHDFCGNGGIDSESQTIGNTDVAKPWGLRLALLAMMVSGRGLRLNKPKSWVPIDRTQLFFK